MELILLSSLVLCFTTLLLLNLFYFFFPTTPVFIGKYFLLYLSDPKWHLIKISILAICYSYHFILNFILYMNLAAFQIHWILWGGTVVPFVLQELNTGNKYYKTIPSLRSPEKLILAYRQVQVLFTNIVPIYGRLLVPAQTLITQLVIFASFLLCKHKNKMDDTMKMVLISWAFLSTITWLGVLQLGGHLHKNGKQLLKSWKFHKWANREETRIMNKFRKSCKPLMMHHGGTYIIKRITVLKFIRGLIKGIFRTLLTLGKR